MYPNLFFSFSLWSCCMCCDGCWWINISFLCSAVSAAAAGPCCVYITSPVLCVLYYYIASGAGDLNRNFFLAPRTFSRSIHTPHLSLSSFFSLCGFSLHPPTPPFYIDTHTHSKRGSTLTWILIPSCLLYVRRGELSMRFFYTHAGLEIARPEYT
jgi:hypothetical protein